jgi:hypothetical protein
LRDAVKNISFYPLFSVLISAFIIQYSTKTASSKKNTSGASQKDVAHFFCPGFKKRIENSKAEEMGRGRTRIRRIFLNTKTQKTQRFLDWNN